MKTILAMIALVSLTTAVYAEEKACEGKTLHACAKVVTKGEKDLKKFEKKHKCACPAAEVAPAAAPAAEAAPKK